MHVISVQIARPTTLDTGRGVITTGIVKQPIDKARFEADGVVGDHIGNTRHHGGADQAVYSYSSEDYSWWEERLGRSLTPGTFGENLTLSTFGEEPIRVGDRFDVGDTVLEVTSPRIPCGTFSARMEIADWVKQFQEARRPGWYARVVSEGVVHAGDVVTRVAAPDTNVEIMAIQDIYYDHSVSSDVLSRALESPVAERTAADLTRRLART